MKHLCSRVLSVQVPAYDGFRTNHGTPNSFSCVSPAEAQGKRRGMLPQYATSNLVEWQPTFDMHIGETLAYLNSLPPNRSVDILGLVAHGLIDVSIPPSIWLWYDS